MSNHAALRAPHENQNRDEKAPRSARTPAAIGGAREPPSSAWRPSQSRPPSISPSALTSLQIQLRLPDVVVGITAQHLHPHPHGRARTRARTPTSASPPNGHLLPLHVTGRAGPAALGAVSRDAERLGAEIAAGGDERGAGCPGPCVRRWAAGVARALRAAARAAGEPGGRAQRRRRVHAGAASAGPGQDPLRR